MNSRLERRRTPRSRNAPVSWLLIFTGLSELKLGSTGASYRPGAHQEHASTPAVSLDPQNVLSLDLEPLLDSVMAASSARNGAHTHHSPYDSINCNTAE